MARLMDDVRWGVLTTIKGSDMKNMWLSITALLALMFAFSGCRVPQTTPRIPVTCSGAPTKDDYLITVRGDLLINGDKCKFRFPQNQKVKFKKPQSKDQ